MKQIFYSLLIILTIDEIDSKSSAYYDFAVIPLQFTEQMYSFACMR